MFVTDDNVLKIINLICNYSWKQDQQAGRGGRRQQTIQYSRYNGGADDQQDIELIKSHQIERDTFVPWATEHQAGYIGR